MKEISLTSFENLKIGQAENSAAGTGCTVFLLGKSGAPTGLDAAGGVMQYLEEHDIGFDVGVTKVPPVCQADLFDLTVADAHIRPDAKMAYQSCINAECGNYQDGNYGAGTGATVGKLLGMSQCMKSCIGSYAVQVGPLYLCRLIRRCSCRSGCRRSTGSTCLCHLFKILSGLRPHQIRKPLDFAFSFLISFMKSNVYAPQGTRKRQSLPVLTETLPFNHH